MKKIYPITIVGLAIILVVAGAVHSLDNGLAKTPPMGWNDFNQYHGSFPEGYSRLQVYCAIADSFVSTGLRDVGYEYIVKDGDNDGTVPYFPGSPGFVEFAKPIADSVHSRNMKFGVYTSTFENPQQTAGDLVAAGVDFVKCDAWTSSQTDPGWSVLGNALIATGGKVLFSTNSCPAASNMWRTGADIDAEWSSIMGDYNSNYSALSQSGPGSWADPDMLEVGCSLEEANGVVLTPAENRAHFSMWCMMASPLMAGYDFAQLLPEYRSTRQYYIETVAIYGNAEVIALDQDPLGKPGMRIKGQGSLEVWVKDLHDGTKAVAFFNTTSSAADMSITQAELGLGTASTQFYVRDLWLHENMPQFTGTFTKNVGVHAAEIYKISIAPISAVSHLRKMDRSIAWLAGNGYGLFPRRMVSGVLSGGDNRAKIFDMRGRVLAAISGTRIRSGMFVMQSSIADQSPVKLAWWTK